MDYLYIATGFAVFIAVALLLEGVWLWWNAKYGQQARRVAQRLRSMAPAGVEQKTELLRQGAQPSSTRAAGWINKLLMQSGSKHGATRFCVVSAAVGIAVLAVLLFAGVNAIIAAGIALAAGMLPLLHTLHKRRKHQERLEQQLPEALELMSRALRAGHALPSAIKMVADEVPDPLGGEFLILFNEVNYGVPMHDALRNLAARLPGSDTGFFVVAALIQRETGGNLAGLIDISARIIRERLKLLAQVEVFSAEGRLSAWILTLLPFGLAFVLHLVNPGFMMVLWKDPAGLQMLAAVAGMMVVGILWMRSVVRIRV